MRSFLSSFLAVVASFAVAAAAFPVFGEEVIKPAGRRIVGGEKTDIKQHPWQVALDIKIDGRTYLCGRLDHRRPLDPYRGALLHTLN